MSIIKSIEDVIPFVNVDQDLSLNSIMPDIDDKEESVLFPLLGETLYQDIHSKHNAETPTLSEPEKELLKHMQKVVVNLAMSEAIDSLTLSINDNAITVGESDREKQPYKYQVENFRKQLLRRGYGAIQDMLDFLFANTALFPDWAETEISNSQRSLLINSADEFQLYEDIKGNRLTFEALKTIIRDVTNIQIEQVLGDEFLAEIQTAVTNDEVTPEINLLLKKYIRFALAKYVIADACDSLPVEIKADGIIVNQLKQEGQEENTATKAQLQSKRMFSERKGDYYINKLREHLNETASATTYATYFSSSLYVAPLEETEQSKPTNIYRA